MLEDDFEIVAFGLRTRSSRSCWRYIPSLLDRIREVRSEDERAIHELPRSILGEVWVAQATAAPAIRTGWARKLRGWHTSVDPTLTSPCWWTTLAGGSLLHSRHNLSLRATN